MDLSAKNFDGRLFEFIFCSICIEMRGIRLFEVKKVIINDRRRLAKQSKCSKQFVQDGTTNKVQLHLYASDQNGYLKT